MHDVVEERHQCLLGRSGVTQHAWAAKGDIDDAKSVAALYRAAHIATDL